MITKLKRKLSKLKSYTALGKEWGWGEKKQEFALFTVVSSVLRHTGLLKHFHKETAKLNQKQISILHLIFHHLTVVCLLFCSLKKGITPNICMLCFVLMNSIFFSFFLTFHAFGSCFRMLGVILVSESFVTSIRHACGKGNCLHFYFFRKIWA